MVASDSVVLLDEDGLAVGTALKESVHHESTPLHLAFSCYLFDPDGNVLITRRALSKRSWPGVWTNSFCGHPAPGEGLEAALRRHAKHELSVTIAEPRLVLPEFRYRATDTQGVVENEVCPVFVATTHDPILGNPTEVADWAWVSTASLTRTAAATPQVLSPWSVLQIPLLAEAFASMGSNT